MTILGRSEELVSRCIECDLAEPESLASLGGSAPGVVDGILSFLPDGAIRFRTGEPDFSSLEDQEYDWTISVYSGAFEQIPHDIPKPLGKHVQTTHYVDANLHHDLATGKAVTAVLHFLNQTPIDAYTKRQSTV